MAFRAERRVASRILRRSRRRRRLARMRRRAPEHRRRCAAACSSMPVHGCRSRAPMARSSSATRPIASIRGRASGWRWCSPAQSCTAPTAASWRSAAIVGARTCRRRRWRTGASKATWSSASGCLMTRGAAATSRPRNRRWSCSRAKRPSMPSAIASMLPARCRSRARRCSSRARRSSSSCRPMGDRSSCCRCAGRCRRSSSRACLAARQRRALRQGCPIRAQRGLPKRHRSRLPACRFWRTMRRAMFRSTRRRNPSERGGPIDCSCVTRSTSPASEVDRRVR